MSRVVVHCGFAAIVIGNGYEHLMSIKGIRTLNEVDLLERPE